MRPGVLVGEALTALLTIADTTYPPYWVGEGVLGVLLFVVLARGLGRSATAWAAAIGTVAVVTAAFAAIYVVNPISLL